MRWRRAVIGRGSMMLSTGLTLSGSGFQPCFHTLVSWPQEAKNGWVTAEQPTGDAKSPSSGTQRTVHIVLAALVVVVLPVVLMEVFVGKFAGDAMFIGLGFGVIGSKIGGTRRMLYVAPGFAVAAGLGAFTAYHWWWAVLLAVLGVIAGGGMYWGWLPTLLMLPFAATFATKVSSGRDAVAYGAIAGIAVAYGVVLARRFKAPADAEGQRVSMPQAVMVAAVFGIALGGSAAIGVALGWTEPYWVPEPILILTLYIIMGKRERIREKALATAVGVVAVVPVALLHLPTWAISVLATTAFVVALTQMKRYWVYYALYTFAVVLALSTPGNVGTEAAHRGSEILTGIGILVIGLAVINALGAWLSKRYPQPELSGAAAP
jgi:Fusaric acid resistance protein-like